VIDLFGERRGFVFTFGGDERRMWMVRSAEMSSVHSEDGRELRRFVAWRGSGMSQKT